MKPCTVVLQMVCVALGLLFLLFGVSQSLIGGLLLGSIMFLAAALLGADHTTNQNPRSRRIFKVMAVLSSLPFAVASASAGIRLWRAGEWGDLVVTLLRLGADFSRRRVCAVR